MNHIGDANKMVDTPRTDGLLTEILDAFGYVHQGNCPQRWVNHSRELERELNAANAKIKRLEEAGDAMAEWLEDMRNLGSDACLSHAWREAKEAKP